MNNQEIQETIFRETYKSFNFDVMDDHFTKARAIIKQYRIWDKPVCYVIHYLVHAAKVCGDNPFPVCQAAIAERIHWMYQTRQAQVCRYLKRLLDQGVIELVKHGGRSGPGLYRLLVEPSAEFWQIASKDTQGKVDFFKRHFHEPPQP